MGKPTARKPGEDDTPKSRLLTNDELKNMWNLIKVATRLSTPEQCMQFAEDNALIRRTKQCNTHRVPMNLVNKGSFGVFECSRGTCRQRPSISRAKGTWFAKTKLPLTQIFYLMYGYAHHWPQAMARFENIMDGPSLSTRTITDWYASCREVVVRYYIERQESADKIGGNGKRVQVDELKFGDSITGKAKSMVGKWVLGIIENDSDDLRLEKCCSNKSPEDIITLIKKHVHEGTIIRTECHQIQNILENNNYVYQAVNRDKPVDTLAHERGKGGADWRLSKQFYHRYNHKNPDNFAEIIVEIAWRKSVKRKRADPFVELIEAVQHSYGV